MRNSNVNQTVEILRNLANQGKKNPPERHFMSAQGDSNVL